MKPLVLDTQSGEALIVLDNVEYVYRQENELFIGFVGKDKMVNFTMKNEPDAVRAVSRILNKCNS